MFRKLLLSFVTGGVIVATAASNSYRVEFYDDSVVHGKTIKAGDYKIEIQNNMAVITQGRHTIEVPAHTESVTDKFDNEELVYDNENLHEIHVKGSRTKIVFDGVTPAAGGSE